MPDILHRVGIESSSATATYRALATIDGLAGWWTGETRGDAKVGGVIHFGFGDHGFFDMKVVELTPDRRVRWRVVDGPPEWIDTTVSFDLAEQDGFTIVRFTHEGWREPVEFMHHCSTKWATFLMSLKARLETGNGAPYPGDVRIGNWR